MSEQKKSVYKPKTISGFPEWLPEVRLVEQQWFDHIRRVFESYGFCSIETPSVEELDVLTAKGEVDKEIYVIERLHKDENEKSSEARLALHFDQTVPLARYVAQHFNDLVFPFKRYQMQRVWRGERPQAGRFREFYQCDLDVIGIDNLPLSFDAELPAIMYEIMTGLPGMANEKIQIRISNRKILYGILEAEGITDPKMAEIITRGLDKREKIGDAKMQSYILEQFAENDLDLNVWLNTKAIAHFLAATGTKFKTTEEIKKEFDLPIYESYRTNDTFNKGIKDLSDVLKDLDHLRPGAVVADLSIVRGLDYYTGTVYETVFLDDPGYGSICSGGRYDDLAGSYINKNLPGVGISIGFSRLFDRLRLKGALDTSRKSAADILMIMPSDEGRAQAAATARTLRQRGFNVELYHAAKKIPDQMKYASRKGIPFVWFPDTAQVKNMITGEQAAADPATWTKS